MAKQPAINVNIAINTVAVEDDVDSFTLNLTQEAPVTTSLSNVGPRRVTGNYDYSLDASGAADFASGQSDATIFDLIGDTGKAVAVDPTGEGAGAGDPNYDSTSVLSSYSISGSVGGRIDFSTTLQGTSALARTVA